jgi:serine protease inhibitor
MRGLVVRALLVLFLLMKSALTVESVPADGLLDSQIRLSNRLVGELTKRSQGGANIVISPAGIAAVMSLLEVGADAKMHAAIAIVLGLADSANRESASDFSSLRAAIVKTTRNPNSNGATSTLSNAVLIDPAARPYDKAIQEMRMLGAEVSVSSTKNHAAIQHLNEWVSRQTRHRITSILGYDEPRSGLVAASVLYFKDKWSAPFSKAQTHLQSFHGVDADQAVPMMFRLGQYYCRRQGRFIAVEVPYGTGRYRLVVVTTTDRSLGSGELSSVADWVSGAGFERATVQLSLPRFTLEGGESLLDPLKEIGLKDGIVSQTAFERLSTIPQSISDIVQKTYMRVDEEGTEVATTTLMTVELSAATEPEKILINRPFLFALRDTETGLILTSGYIGRLPANPSSH